MKQNARELVMTAAQALPRVFIGSSSEGRRVAEAIAHGVRHVSTPQLWTAGVFGIGRGYLESLVEVDVDFAIMVVTPDDLVASRGARQHAARDNVVFECGLFMGRLGRERTFIAHDRSTKVKLPSDLDGISWAKFTGGRRVIRQADVHEACDAIGAAISRLGFLRPPLAAVWMPLMTGPTQVVLPRFRKYQGLNFDDFERTGLLGAGDAAALGVVAAHMQERTGAAPSIRFADALDGVALDTNLLCLGGPDANPVTRKVMQSSRSSLLTEGVDIVDRVGRGRYGASIGKDGVVADSAAIISMPSPFADERHVVLAFGSFGFGTWAAARALAAATPNDPLGSLAHFEAVLEVPVYNDAPQRARVAFVRPLAVADNRQRDARPGVGSRRRRSTRSGDHR